MKNFLISKRAITRTQTMIIAAIVIVAAIAGGAYYAFFMPTAPPAKDYIIIGRTLALTGKYVDPSLMALKGWELWMEMVNEDGGIYVPEYGKKLNVTTIYYDDESDPATAAELYRKLIEVNKVDLLVGPYASAVNYAVEPIAESYKMILPICEGTSSDLYKRGYKYCFMCGAGGVATHYTYLFVKWLSELPTDKKPKKVAIVAEDTAFPKDVLAGNLEFCAEYGFEVVHQELYPKGTTDFIPTVSAARDKGAEVLICGTYFPDAAGIVRACKEIGYSPKAIMCTVGPALPEWGPELGADGDYVFSCSDYIMAAKTPGNEEFVSRFKAKYGMDPSYHSARDFSAGTMLKQAIEAVGLNQDKLRDYFFSGVEFQTILGTIRISTYKDLVGITYPPAYTIVQWQSGKMEVVLPESAKTAEIIYPMPTWEER